MIAKLAYLTSPAPDRYILNYQVEGSEELCQLEIQEAHVANIVIDGASFALRRSANRVQFPLAESADDSRRQPA